MGTLKARVDGAWVNIGSGNEVAVQADDPIGLQPGTELWYDTDAVAPVVLQSASMPRVVALVTKTTNQTGFTGTPTDVAGLTVSFVADPAHRYRVSVETFISASAANSGGNLMIADGAGTQLASTQITCSPQVGQSIKAMCTYWMVGASGDKTVKARAYIGSGAGTIDIAAGAAYPTYFVVEDMGLVPGPEIPGVASDGPRGVVAWKIGNGTGLPLTGTKSTIGTMQVPMVAGRAYEITIKCRALTSQAGANMGRTWDVQPTTEEAVDAYFWTTGNYGNVNWSWLVFPTVTRTYLLSITMTGGNNAGNVWTDNSMWYAKDVGKAIAMSA